ncbi:MAG TPA: hypothetical protein DCS30_02545 [Rhizobiales bacterium]|nr:hypothetical protein [Hyphomicrobiales bacterium]
MDEQKKASPKRSLEKAIRDVRLNDVDQDSVVVELGDTERARLELLNEALEEVRAELPEDMDQAILQIIPGRKQRFWVDLLAFVEMGRDKRTYRFVKDTRMGRVVIREGSDVDDIADQVTHYLARRIIEREKALESDDLMDKLGKTAAEPVTDLAQSQRAPAAKRSGGLMMFLIGILFGAAGLLAYAWYAPSPF